MRLRLSARYALLISLALVVAGIAITLFVGGASPVGASHDLHQLFLCALATVVFSFVFGALRYDLASGVVLLLASLHDLALTCALALAFGRLMPLHPLFPVMVLSAPLFTFSLTIPLLRSARELSRNTSLRNKNRVEVAEEALSDRSTMHFAAALGALLLLAAAIGGGAGLAAAMVPLALSLLSSWYCMRFISPYTWVVATERFRARKPAR